MHHAFARQDAAGVFRGVGQSLPAMQADGGKRAGTEAEVIRAAPVSEIVSGLAAGTGVVGDFVVVEAGAGERIDGGLEEVRVAVVVLAERAELQLAEIGGVFL